MILLLPSYLVLTDELPDEVLSGDGDLLCRYRISSVKSTRKVIRQVQVAKDVEFRNSTCNYSLRPRNKIGI